MLLWSLAIAEGTGENSENIRRVKCAQKGFQSSSPPPYQNQRSCGISRMPIRGCAKDGGKRALEKSAGDGTFLHGGWYEVPIRINGIQTLPGRLAAIRCLRVISECQAKEGSGMCRNIRTLFNFEPPVTSEEIRAASLQYVRKISGFTHPSKANENAFEAAIEEVAKASARLLRSLETSCSGEEPGRGSGESASARGRTVRRLNSGRRGSSLQSRFANVALQMRLCEPQGRAADRT